MQKYNKATIQKAKTLFSSRSGQEFTEEKAKEALSNLVSFVEILQKWDREEKKKVID